MIKFFRSAPLGLPALLVFLVIVCVFQTAVASPSVVFGSEYMQGEQPAFALKALWKRTGQIGRDYKQDLDDASPFNGLYARGEGWRSTQRDAYEYKYGIDLELYENGRYEAKRRIEKNKLESEVQNLQLLEDMRLRSADESHHQLRLIGRRVRLNYALEYRDLVRAQLDKARHEFENGLLSQNDFNAYVARNIEAEMLAESYPGASSLGVPQPWFYLLNAAENLRLIDKGALFGLVRERSYSLKLQTLFQRRALFHETWRDDLSFRLYLEKRYNDYNQRHDTVAGFRVRLPLDKPDNRDELIGYEQDVYQSQIEAIHQRYRQRVDDNYAFFLDQQVILRKLESRHRATLESIDNNAQHAQLVLPNLPYTPEKENRVLYREKRNLNRDILLQRIRVVEILFTLSNLAQSKRPAEILGRTLPEIISIRLTD